MALRDIIVTLIVFGALPYIIMRPWVGIMMFSWLGYMNPHRLSWGFAYNFPFAQVVALVTIVSMLFSKDRNPFPWRLPVVLLMLFILWQTVTTLYAFYDYAWEEWMRMIKIQVVVFMTLLLITTPKILNYLIWVIVVSISFFGIKGGIFTILSGGQHLIWGPDGSFIQGNNEIGLAMLMVLPLHMYLARREERTWLRRGLYMTAGLVLLSIVATYSRGALVGLIAMLMFLWFKSPYKMITGFIGVIALALILVFMPQQWHDRMATTINYEEDASAMSRINSWSMAMNLAGDRLTGGGYSTWTPEQFAKYADDPTVVFDAHSIYFEVLGEHGYIGLVLFLSLLVVGWLQGTWVIRQARGRPHLTDIANLVKMTQVGLVAYMSGGAFLGLAYFDLYYHLFAILILARMLVERELAGEDLLDTEEYVEREQLRGGFLLGPSPS